MNKTELKKIAFSALCEDACKSIEIKECENLQVMPYGFNRSEEILFHYSYTHEHMVGGDKYISVSKTTGKVRFYGRCGD